ncbi:MAG: hypothetical protein HYY02_00840 [Chloroflexi bacterium]|nr:hypothetical protein [Chloroflexota bacterium]
MADELARRLRALVRVRTDAVVAAKSANAPAAAEAVLQERLRALEAEVAEVRGRVNGLLFAVLGALLVQLLLRLLA